MADKDHRVVIRISAAADGSLGSAIDPLAKSAARARTQVQKESKAAADATAKEAQRGAQAAAKANDAIAKAFAKREAESTKVAEKAAQERTKSALKEFDERAKASAKARAAEEKDILATAEAAEKASKRKAAAAEKAAKADRIARNERVADSVKNNIGSLGHRAVDLGKTLFAGEGVEFGLESHVRNAVSLQATASKISNEAYMPNEGKARVDPAEIEKRIKEAADSAGFGREGAASGLQEFVKSTGDLDTGLSSMKELGALAQAANADFGQLMGTAGQVSASLGDIPDKGKVVVEIMKNIAGAGKLGAITIEKLGGNMGKLVGGAGMFVGDKGSNIITLNALAQISKEHGMSGSASQAVTSSNALAFDMLTAKQAAKFSSYGIDVLSPDKKKLADPTETIVKSLNATGGNIDKMKDLFKSSQAWRSVAGSVETYNRAGGGKAGESAVRAELQSFGAGSTMGTKEINDSLARRLNDTDVKAQLMNNRFDDIAERLQSRLAPALEKLAPYIEKAANAFADLIAWAGENPGSAIALAITGSIAKAGIGEAISSAMKGVISGGAGNGLSGLSSALGVATAAAAGFAAGMALVNAGFEQKAKGESDEFQRQATSQNLKADFLSGKASASEMLGDANATLKRIQSSAGQGLSKYDAAQLTGGIDYASVAANKLTNGMFGQGSEAQRNTQAQAAQAGNNAVDFVTALQAIKDKAPAGSDELKTAAAELSAAAKVVAMAGVAMPGGGRSAPGRGLGPG